VVVALSVLLAGAGIYAIATTGDSTPVERTNASSSKSESAQPTKPADLVEVAPDPDAEGAPNPSPASTSAPRVVPSSVREPLSPALERALRAPVEDADLVAEGEVDGGGLWRLWSHPHEGGDPDAYCLSMRVFSRARGEGSAMATGGGSGNCDYRRSMMAGGEPFAGHALVWYGGYTNELASIEGSITESGARAIETIVAPIPGYPAVAFIVVMPDAYGTHRLVGRDATGRDLGTFTWLWKGS
jgi:hypothetical protein